MSAEFWNHPPIEFLCPGCGDPLRIDFGPEMYEFNFHRFAHYRWQLIVDMKVVHECNIGGGGGGGGSGDRVPRVPPPPPPPPRLERVAMTDEEFDAGLVSMLEDEG